MTMEASNLDDISEVDISKDITESLIAIGLNSILGTNKYGELKEEILKDHPEIIQSRLIEVDLGIQMKIIEGLLLSNPTALMEDEFWKDYLVKALKEFDECSDAHIYANGSWFVLLNRIMDMSVKIDWFEVLSRLSLATAHGNNVAPGFPTVLSWLMDADSSNLKKLLHRTETKKYPRELKEELYKKIVELGDLDVKIARRIRSDSSGELSVTVLSGLFENRLKYSDEDFQNLITQFTDTKHKWVARYIAMNMPMQLVGFLMGIKDPMALDILEKRMEAADN